MNVLSDSESSDSDTGRRFKTASTRNRDVFGSHRNGTGDRNPRNSDRSRRPRSRSREGSGSTRRRSPIGEKHPEWRKSNQHSDRPRRPRSRSRDLGGSTRRRSQSREEPSERRKTNAERDRFKEPNRSRENSRSRTRGHRERSSSRRDDQPGSRRNTPAREESKKVDSREKRRSTSTERQARERKRSKSPAESRQEESEVKSKKSKHKKHKHKSRRGEKETSKKEKLHGPSVEVDRESNLSEQSAASALLNSDQLPSEFEVIDEVACGPALPPHMQGPSGEDCVDDQLPPAESVEGKRHIGPSLPSGVDLSALASQYKPTEESGASDISDDDDNDDDDDDGDVIGPLPDGATKSNAQLELEKRALELRLAKLNEREAQGSDEPVREEWMTALPDIKGVAGLGLVARQFRTKERDAIGDRSGWTDTPQDRERKTHKLAPTTEEVNAARQQESEAMYRAKRDAEQEAAARKHKKKHKRDESLLDLHQRKLKKKMEKEKAKEEGKEERRPFSRDTDLKVNRFDEAQKKSILKKAQLLDTRFGSGQSKYL